MKNTKLIESDELTTLVKQGVARAIESNDATLTAEEVNQVSGGHINNLQVSFATRYILLPFPFGQPDPTDYLFNFDKLGKFGNNY